MTHPRDLDDVLLALGRAGVKLAPDPDDADRLRFKPRTLPPALLGRLRAHKPGVLALLAPDGLRALEADPEGGYVLAERLGVADGLGMPTHPGSAARLVAVGEALGATDGTTSPTGGNPG